MQSYHGIHRTCVTVSCTKYELCCHVLLYGCALGVPQRFMLMCALLHAILPTDISVICHHAFMGARSNRQPGSHRTVVGLVTDFDSSPALRSVCIALMATRTAVKSPRANGSPPQDILGEYPHAKVILSVRDPQSWWASFISSVHNDAPLARSSGKPFGAQHIVETS